MNEVYIHDIKRTETKSMATIPLTQLSLILLVQKISDSYLTTLNIKYLVLL